MAVMLSQSKKSIHIGFVHPSEKHFPSDPDAASSHAVAAGLLGRDSLATTAPATAATTAGIKALDASTLDAPHLLPPPAETGEQPTLVLSKSIANGGCKRIFDTKRHHVARRLLQAALASGAPPPTGSPDEVQDLLDGVASDPSEGTVLAAYAALMKRCADLYPCVQDRCDIAQQSLLQDLVYLQGVCQEQCVTACSRITRLCLDGINTLLVVLQPGVCRRDDVLVVDADPELVKAVNLIRSMQ